MAERSAPDMHNNILVRKLVTTAKKTPVVRNIAPAPVGCTVLDSKQVDKCPKLSKAQKEDIWDWYGQFHAEPQLPDNIGEQVVYPSHAELIKGCAMKPDIDVQQSVELSLDNVTLFMVRDGWLDGSGLGALRGVDVDYEAMVDNVPKLLDLDFSSLRLPCLDYMEQDEISRSRVRLMGACAVRYAMNFAMVARYLGGEYTAAHRDVTKALDQLQGHIPHDDLLHIERILTRGCPNTLDYVETREMKMRMLRRGNQKTLTT